MNMQPVEHAPNGYSKPWYPLIVVPLSTGDSRDIDGHTPADHRHRRADRTARRTQTMVATPPRPVKKPHHAGSFHADSKRVRAQAKANPLTICWRCSRTLNLHPPHTDGKPARWTAGHTIDSSTSAQPWLEPMTTHDHTQRATRGDWLAPEASVCNYANLPTPTGATTTHNW